jgi:hypothetical protein
MTETLRDMSPPDEALATPKNEAAEGSQLEIVAQPSTEELEIARELVRSARARGVALTGPDGMLKALTKTVIETALDEEMADHLGYDKHDPVGRNTGNSRNGTRTKTVLTDNVGPVEISVPRDRDSTFNPVIVAKRQRRLGDVDTIVLSLTAKGLTTGEVSAHFAEIYGASLSKDTISRITDRVIAEMAEWTARPLEKRQCLTNVANPYGRDSHAQIRVEQVATRREAPLLRTHTAGAQRLDRIAAGRRVAQLRVAVVYRRWQRELHREADQRQVSQPGRPNRNRRRPRRR